MEDYLRVGVISSTHGIKGEVKVFPTTDDVNRFKQLNDVYADTGIEKKRLEIENVKFFKQMAILKFKGIDDINEIVPYKGMDLLILRENAVKLDKGEYFIFDLIDCKVRTEDGSELGILAEVLQTGANDVYVVKTPEGKEILLPYIKECILKIDIENKIITAHIMEGLLN